MNNVAGIRHQGFSLIGLKLFLKKIFLKKDEKSTLPYYLNNFLLVYIAYLSNFGSKTYSTRALPSSTKIIKNPIRRTFYVKCVIT
jgi:hypothetical protein